MPGTQHRITGVSKNVTTSDGKAGEHHHEVKYVVDLVED
jgi:hypothetical protein